MIKIRKDFDFDLGRWHAVLLALRHISVIPFKTSDIKYFHESNIPFCTYIRQSFIEPPPPLRFVYQLNPTALLYTLIAFVAFMTAAIIGYNPSNGMMSRKGGS